MPQYTNFLYSFHFYLFGLIAIASAIIFVTRKSPVAAALWLVNVMFCLAALFVLLDAPFVGIIQILVYAGAIMVVFLFVIMLLNLGRVATSDRKGPVGIAVAVLLAGTLLLQLSVVARSAPPAAIRLPPGMVAQMQQSQGMVGAIAGPLYSDYLVPFEITSLLLLAAVVGAVVLAKRKL